MDFRAEPAGAGESGGGTGAAVASGSVQDVANLVTVMGKAARASQLYRSDNPMYHRFLTTLRDAFGATWDRLPALELSVEEHGFSWQEEPVVAESGHDGLAFLFYKDGVRQLRFLPGFETEVDRFLDVMGRARRVDSNSDDIITLLWDADFESLQYAFVQAGLEGLELPEPGGGVLEPISTQMLRAEAPEAAEAEGAAATDEAVPGARVRAGLTPEDFEETLYLLDDSELDELKAELDREWDRDVKSAVVAALFDRIEDPRPGRQCEIIAILRQVLPSSFAVGDFGAAATILRELQSLLMREPPVLGEEARVEVDGLLEELSEPALVEQLVQALEHTGDATVGEELVTLVSQLRSPALSSLIRASRTAPSDWVKKLLSRAAQSVGAAWPERLVSLIGDEDPVVAGGSARIAGALRLTEAVAALIRLLKSEAVELRRAAVDALVLLRTAESLSSLQRALEDADRDVRIAAARGLGGLRHRSSRERFEKVLRSRMLRGADLTEQMAMFEAYGDLGAPESVAFLDRLLNGRRFPARREPREVRACAALALGRLGIPAATHSLERAQRDPEPVVRNAVARALKGERGDARSLFG